MLTFHLSFDRKAGFVFSERFFRYGFLIYVLGCFFDMNVDFSFVFGINAEFVFSERFFRYEFLIYVFACFLTEMFYLTFGAVL
jgi:hypothetical protein